MIIITTHGGGGSTFLLNQFNLLNYWPRATQRVVEAIDRRLRLKGQLFLRLLRLYRHHYAVLIRPDTFFSDTKHNLRGLYDVDFIHSAEGLRQQKEYIVSSWRSRGGRIPVPPDALDDSSLLALARSYLEFLRAEEAKAGFEVVFISGFWGQWGIYKELGVPAVYLIRDPANAILSFSKPIRHEKEFRRLGLSDPGSLEWIDAYLEGPIHWWVQMARTALAHEQGRIIRYNQFAEDWRKWLPDLPDISGGFSYSENQPAAAFSPEILKHIAEKTGPLCREIGLPLPDAL